MKKTIVFLFLAVFVLAMVLVLGSCVKAQAQSIGSVRWEYISVLMHVRNENPSERLNQLGREGWELVSVAAGDGNSDSNHYFHFKRRLP